jgi:hypothetical protein
MNFPHKSANKSANKILTKIINHSIRNVVEIAFAVLVIDCLIVLTGSGIL